MSSKHNEHIPVTDLSTDLREEHAWQVNILRSFRYLLNVTAWAIEPVSGLLAIGTADGSVHLFGGPGVECKLRLPRSSCVKFLQYATSAYRLVCVDYENHLHIWDLGAKEEPKHLVSASFHQTINSIAVSPSHTHAFVALQSGEIETYDLLCLRKSPYRIPNMWTVYERKTVGGDTHAAPSLTDCSSIDLAIHPRDLNYLFIAYGGGVVLTDLTQRNIFRAYELTLPPGAPGGAGCGHKNSLKHRRLSVTALAIHPAGHLLAAGYADGSIAFWAVEDDHKPVLVRTVDRENVDIVDGPQLEESLRLGQEGHVKPHADLPLEPIFKLSWSGFLDDSGALRGETVLTILGGLTADHASGLTIHWFPSNFATQSTTSATSSQGESWRESLVPFHTSFLPTKGITQDYLIVPRNTPHFSGSFDPIAILLLCEGDGKTRSTEAYQFPQIVSNKSSTIEPSDSAATASTASVQIRDDFLGLELPSSLRNGNNGIIASRLINLGRAAYGQLVRESHIEGHLSLRGGVAWTDDLAVNEKTFAKYQSPRISVTTHVDLTVRFEDTSADLLINPNRSPMRYPFPRPLPDLTIDVMSILSDPVVLSRISPTLPRQARIDSIHVARESLECGMVLQTGEVIICRMRSNSHKITASREVSDEELILLEHMTPLAGRRFYPFLMLAAGRTRLTTFAISDIGFMAVAYGDGSLLVVDLRGPRVLSRHVQNIKNNKKESALHSVLRHSELVDPVGSLTWTITALGRSSWPKVLLIAVRASGLTEVFTISRAPGASLWVMEKDCLQTRTVQQPLPGGTFVLDSKTGIRRKADSSRLALSLQNPSSVLEPPGILIAAGVKGIKCIADITGEKLGKTEWSGKSGTAQSVQVVEKMGSHALVVFTDKNEGLVYSLPHLEHLHTFQIPTTSTDSLSSDETGDFTGCSRHPASGIVNELIYASFFTARRKYAAPHVDLTSTKPVVPPQPQPIPSSTTSALTSWLGFGSSVSGEELDVLLAGPDRPTPQQEETGPVSSAAIASASSETLTGLYGRLTSALNERGQLLEGLEERFNSLEEGSRNMAAQAKRLAMEQQAKNWFGL